MKKALFSILLLGSITLFMTGCASHKATVGDATEVKSTSASITATFTIKDAKGTCGLKLSNGQAETFVAANLDASTHNMVLNEGTSYNEFKSVIKLTNLKPGTTYTYRAYAKDTMSECASDYKSFTTPSK